MTIITIKMITILGHWTQNVLFFLDKIKKYNREDVSTILHYKKTV